MPNEELSIEQAGELESQQKGIVTRINKSFERFTKGLEDVFNDITALEVNTMVVSNITGRKFNPLESYRQIYELQNDKMESLKSLYTQLESAYQTAFKTTEIPPPYSEIFTDPQKREEILDNSEFLLSLRKLIELKALLSGIDANDPNNFYDLIYAQTVIQIDGDVIHRFHKSLINKNIEQAQQEFLIKIHQEAVKEGENNWRELLSFMQDLMEKIVKYFSNPK
jgi:hypothetical protein